MMTAEQLVLYISTDVPEPPTLFMEEPFLTVRRIPVSHFPAESDGELQGFMLSHREFVRNASLFSSFGTDSAPILLWNPDGATIPAKAPGFLVFQEISGFGSPDSFLRTVKSLYRSLVLERELARKREQLQAKEKVFNEILGIGIALSAERENQRLLNLILQRTREITRADAGSLYLLLREESTGEQYLLFKIAHNDSNPTDFTEFRMPLNTSSIAGNVAVHGKVLNIPDAYDIPADIGVTFNQSFDKSTGYRTKSLLTVPMMDHKGQILGVIQLINRKRDFATRLSSPAVVEEHVESFDAENESVVLSLASMAAVSLENNMLYDEIEALFEGFVKASVKAIESRDPTTSGHSSRVALYTVGLAEETSRIQTGPYADLSFSREQIKEIRYASLLHDFGKVGVRENVLVKAKKLYPEQLRLIEERFAYIRKSLEARYIAKRFSLLKDGGPEALAREEETLRRDEERDIEEVGRALDAIVEANEPKLLSEEPAKIIDTIAHMTYTDLTGKELPFVTEQERLMLMIRKGSLSEAERKEIESHVIHSYEFLKNIPWTSQLKAIPEIARGHHEKLAGGGYPDGSKGESIPVQTKMMAIADIYDALTAMDRPYKHALPPEKALAIIEEEAEAGNLDKELVSIFINAKVYARTE